MSTSIEAVTLCLLATELANRDREKKRVFFLACSLLRAKWIPRRSSASVSCPTHALDVDCYSNHSRRLMIFFFLLFLLFLLLLFYCLCYMSASIDCSNEWINEWANEQEGRGRVYRVYVYIYIHIHIHIRCVVLSHDERQKERSSESVIVHTQVFDKR
jgi:hypothetical protein